MWQYLRFRFQRWRRRLRREARILYSWSGNYIDRHIWGKWRQLGLSRRFITGWAGLLLVLLLGLALQTNQILKPFRHTGMAAEASFSEGSLSEVKLINPVLPDSSGSADLNRLIFDGLTRYNDRGQLEPDLATSWEISADGKTYTFHLRRGVKWHDGVPFTSQDVAFTLAAIQNPDTRSPLTNSWQGITADPVDDFTVVYHLPNAYPPFLAATTQGIVPRHLLESVDPPALRANDFNQKPVGTGPYVIKSFLPEQRLVELSANPNYFGGAPQIKTVEYHWYGSTAELESAYAKHQILAFGDLAPADLASISKLTNLKIYSYNQMVETLLVMRNSQTILKDPAVRQAIALAINRPQIIDAALAGQAEAVASPILPGQLGYQGKFQLPKTDLSKAASLLDSDGWTLQQGRRRQAGQDLKLSLVTRDGGADPRVAAIIKRQLAQLGIVVNVQTADLDTLEQTYIRPRNYDLLLFGYDIGADPDVYAYWHSSQASDPGLNLAVYNSPVADKALEGGRINPDPMIRAGKYQTFLSQWQADTPSLPLFSANYLYAVSTKVTGVGGQKLIDPSDRFYNIQNWTVATAPVH